MSNKPIEESYETFRRLLNDYAPLPWQIVGGFICDANGQAILSSTVSDSETERRVLGAVITGVATCGGFLLEFTDDTGAVMRG